MILIASSFFAVMLITFAVVSFATAPTKIDKTLQARLAAVTADKVGGLSTASLRSQRIAAQDRYQQIRLDRPVPQ